MSIEYLEVAESLTSAGLLSSALPADARLDGDEDVPVAAVQGDGGRPRDQPGGEARPDQQEHHQHLGCLQQAVSFSIGEGGTLTGTILTVNNYSI